MPPAGRPTKVYASGSIGGIVIAFLHRPSGLWRNGGHGSCSIGPSRSPQCDACLSPHKEACSMVAIQVRAAEPRDVEAIAEICSCPGVIAGTLQLPFRSIEERRGRLRCAAESMSMPIRWPACDGEAKPGAICHRAPVIASTGPELTVVSSLRRYA